MTGLTDEVGRYRAGNVGTMQGESVVHWHRLPPSHRVKQLMEALLQWFATTDQRPLIISSVCHYEFEFIHPFADGNGRMRQSVMANINA